MAKTAELEIAAKIEKWFQRLRGRYPLLDC